jgi:hypothetical protein
MRRYYLVNVAKDANVFGILVGTLAVGSLSLSLSLLYLLVMFEVSI